VDEVELHLTPDELAAVWALISIAAALGSLMVGRLVDPTPHLEALENVSEGTTDRLVDKLRTAMQQVVLS
jgi:hypothetical protein